jgi:hypothetical protein
VNLNNISTKISTMLSFFYVKTTGELADVVMLSSPSMKLINLVLLRLFWHPIILVWSGLCVGGYSQITLL